MDKQMGKDGKLTRATELGYICWWRWTPWAEAPRGHSRTFPSALQPRLRDVGLGTSCKSCSSAPAPRGLGCTLVLGSLSHGPTAGVCGKKLCLPDWFFLPLPVLALRSKPSFPIQAPVSPELQSTMLQGTHLDGHQPPCCHSLRASCAAQKTRRAPSRNSNHSWCKNQKTQTQPTAAGSALLQDPLSKHLCLLPAPPASAPALT